MSGLSGVGVFWAFTSILSAIISCVGYFMPHWITGRITLQHPGKSPQITPVHFGIFRRCNYPYIGDDGTLTISHECGRYTAFSDIPSVSWQIATLTVGVGCCLCLLVSLTAMFGVCVKGVVIPTVARTAGIIQMCSGDCSLSWCFYVTSAGIVMTLMCSALSFHAPKWKQIPAGYALLQNK
ncbi:LHFPL tetraspan subfamily member 6 protein-like isoform X2 [Mya arenaria]|uniref:LHFPL tetraspan subfamily member 6 protein-like isoform X2 n=1 Tax=Mya arenaria TaxID=6604 RepID=UPI0022E7A96F|nr:LHFPL tetraspan subfamily member 6 protein-like isoform X2 [Mya arenaria]